MRVVFDHSWQLLNQAERAIFGRLTVFQGGFTVATSHAVAGASLADLSALVSKSLVQRTPDGRYQIHELLRQYSVEKLAASPAEAIAAPRAHADYFLAYLYERHTMFDGTDQLRAVKEIEAEYENVYAAWRWSVLHIQTQAQAEAVRTALRTLTDYYQMRSRYLEGAEILADTIRHLESDELSGLSEAALAESLTCFGWLAIRLGRLAEAKQALTRASQLYEQYSLPPPQYRAGNPQMVFLILALVQGDYGRAAALGQELRHLAQQHNQPSALVLAYYGSASAALAQGDYDVARHYAEQGLDLGESLGIPFQITNIHDVLGQVACIEGELQVAKHHFEAAYAISVAFQAQGDMAAHLKNLGDVAIRQHLWPEAYTLYQQSLEHYQAIGDLGGTSAAERMLGITAYHIGDLNDARYHFGHALENAVAIQSERSILAVLASVGTFMFAHARTHRGQALGERVLRFVIHHPSCDRVTYEDAAACLGQSGVPRDRAPNDTLEEVVTALKVELRAAARIATSTDVIPPHSFGLVESLTSREVEVLKLLVVGHSNIEIARKLVIAVGTVKTHTSNLYRKLDVLNRTQAVARAHKLGLLD